MKLLVPQATNDATATETARSVLRAQEYQRLEKEFRIKMANAEADFNATLARNRGLWAEEEEKHQKRMEEMKREIQEAENEKLKMLVPFDILKEGSNERFKNAEEFLDGLRKRESRAEELTELLEDKLDVVGEKESDLDRLKTELILKQKGMDSQNESVVRNAEVLTAQMRGFYAEKSKKENELKERESAVFLREQSAKSKEEGILAREKDIKDQQTRISDERGVLAQAWEELKRMKG